MNALTVGAPAPTTRRPSGRRRKMLVRSIPMFAWLLAELVVVVIHRWVPMPRWLMVHLLLLGAVTNAIVVWSRYFSDAVLRAAGENRLRDWLILGGVNVGGLGVVFGLTGNLPPLLWGGAVLVGAAALVHAGGLIHGLRTGLPGRFAVAIRYYIAAGLALPVGVWLGVRLGSAPPDFDRLLIAHLGANLLGWVGLTIAGTLITLWPTMLRTRADDKAIPSGRQAWWVLTLSVAVMMIGGYVGLRWLVVAGLFAYAIGLGILAGPLVRAALGRRPQSFGTWSVMAGFAWWIGTLVAAILALAMAPDLATGVEGVRGLVGPFAVGFVAQVLVGALSYLLPVVIGGGPAVVRRMVAIADRSTFTRIALVNGSALLFLLPLPSVVLVAVSLVVYAGLVWTLILLVATVITGLRLIRSGVPAGEKPEVDSLVERRTHRGQLTLAASIIALAVVAAALVDPVAVVGRYAGPGTTAGVAPTGRTTTVQVTAHHMVFTPAVIEVPAGDRLVIELTNTDPAQVHDLVLANGVSSGRLSPGASTVVDVGVVGSDLDGWCSIAGHRQMGMTLVVRAIGAPAGDHAGHAAASGEPAATGNVAGTPGPGFRARDAVLPPAPETTIHRHTFTVSETDAEVAPGVRQSLWTFNGTAPGPALRGKVGDVFEITFVNDGTIGHGIDFHAGALAPDKPMRVIAPGEQLTYRFTAQRAGIWMYHCSAMPMSLHIANGMFGAVIIDPPDLPPVDKEFLLVQSEQYWGPQGAAGDADKIGARTPDAVVFNGYPNQYHQEPLTARTGERVRIWILNAGPNESIAFHVVGGQFDSVWSEGDWRLRPGPGGSQTLGLMASQGGFVELVMPEAGNYSLVNHQMSLAEKGASGVLHVTD